MKLTQCAHKPHVVRIVFDKVFNDFIITKEAILENKTTEVKFSSHTSADTSNTKEITV
jgi:hypothetical protein